MGSVDDIGDIGDMGSMGSVGDMDKRQVLPVAVFFILDLRAITVSKTADRTVFSASCTKKNFACSRS